METGARRLQQFAELVSSLLVWKSDFERRLGVLIATLASTRGAWADSRTPATYPEAMADLAEFAGYKKTSKRDWVKERQELGALYSNIQTKSRTYGLQTWEPAEGCRLGDLEREWTGFGVAEGVRSRAINARIRE